MDDDTREVRVDGVRAAATVGVSRSSGTHMAIHWAQIAIVNAHGARRARHALADANRRASPLESALATELHASLIAISAAAHALDALFAELRPLVVTQEVQNGWKKSRAKRRQQIRETFKHGFRISGAQWGTDFDWLLDLRTDALYPGIAPGDPRARSHPLGIGAAPELCEFTCEQAERAARLIVDVYRTCTAYPWPASEEWAQEMRPMVEKLQADLDSALS